MLGCAAELTSPPQVILSLGRMARTLASDRMRRSRSVLAIAPPALGVPRWMPGARWTEAAIGRSARADACAGGPCRAGDDFVLVVRATSPRFQ